ncbi:MAG: ParB N-terminal domain-containing protein [Rhodospirillaceae bacterium]|nr:ParB N-terminal domain-containing protein [Rhodospirillales bacterium]
MTDAPHPAAAALEALMKQHGLSQKALARGMEERGLKTAQSTLSYISSGKNPDLSTAKKLAEFFAQPVTIFLPELAQLVPAGGDPALVRVPLSNTRLSTENERRSYDTAAIGDLAHDIQHQGLLQNLVGYREDDAVTIWGGGRRWRALRLLETEGGLPADIAAHGVPVKLMADRLACLKATISENAQREDVHFLDRAEALARVQDETGWSATRVANELSLGERTVQQLLQIYRTLPDWACERAMLPKDNPEHLKFRDCRDIVEQKRAAPISGTAALNALTSGQGSENGPPLPLPAPAPRFSKEEVGAALTALQNSRRPDEEPVSLRLRRALNVINPGAIDRRPGDLVVDALGDNGTDVLSSTLEEEFGISTETLDLDGINTLTLGALSRWIIAEMSTTAAPVAAEPDEDDGRLKAQMELARAASNGSLALRDGADKATVTLGGEELRFVPGLETPMDDKLAQRFVAAMNKRPDLIGPGGTHRTYIIIAGGESLSLDARDGTLRIIFFTNSAGCNYGTGCFGTGKVERLIRRWLVIAENQRVWTDLGEGWRIDNASTTPGRVHHVMIINEDGQRMSLVPDQRDIEDSGDSDLLRTLRRRGYDLHNIIMEGGDFSRLEMIALASRQIYHFIPTTCIPKTAPGAGGED